MLGKSFDVCLIQSGNNQACFLSSQAFQQEVLLWKEPTSLQFKITFLNENTKFGISFEGEEEKEDLKPCAFGIITYYTQ